jgi:predicted metal-dependent hydrolase
MHKIWKKMIQATRKPQEVKTYYAGSHLVIVKPNRLSRSLRLRIDPIRKLPVLSVPLHCSAQSIEDFLKKGAPWIQQQLGHVNPTLLYPEVICFKGEIYQISLTDTLSHKRQILVDQEEKKIFLACAPELVQVRLKNHFRKRALQESIYHCERFANQLSVAIQRIEVKDYRARWGSCSRSGVITLSWRLIMASPRIFEYVCAHEVAHLVHHNHSKDFWQVVDWLCPNYKELRAELKTIGMTLFHAL